MSRTYDGRIEPDTCEVFTVEGWLGWIRVGAFNEYDGSGYWAKDGLESEDDVFSTLPEDATHVVWFNK